MSRIVRICSFLCVVLVATAVEGQPDPEPIKVSAKQLTADFVKNRDAAAKKYGDAMNPKEILVEGKVGDVVTGKYGQIARLEGEGKYVVSVLLRKEDVDVVKKGQTVAFKGKCRGLFPSEKLVDINGGVLQKNEKEK